MYLEKNLEFIDMSLFEKIFLTISNNEIVIHNLMPAFFVVLIAMLFLFGELFSLGRKINPLPLAILATFGLYYYTANYIEKNKIPEFERKIEQSNYVQCIKNYDLSKSRTSSILNKDWDAIHHCYKKSILEKLSNNEDINKDYNFIQDIVKNKDGTDVNYLYYIGGYLLLFMFIHSVFTSLLGEEQEEDMYLSAGTTWSGRRTVEMILALTIGYLLVANVVKPWELRDKVTKQEIFKNQKKIREEFALVKKENEKIYNLHDFLDNGLLLKRILIRGNPKKFINLYNNKELNNDFFILTIKSYLHDNENETYKTDKKLFNKYLKKAKNILIKKGEVDSNIIAEHPEFFTYNTYYFLENYDYKYISQIIGYLPQKKCDVLEKIAKISTDWVWKDRAIGKNIQKNKTLIINDSRKYNCYNELRKIGE